MLYAIPPDYSCNVLIIYLPYTLVYIFYLYMLNLADNAAILILFYACFFLNICSYILTIVLNNILFPRLAYTNFNFLQDPMISKMILSANDFGCSDEILTIASFLSVQVRICISLISFFLSILKF